VSVSFEDMLRAMITQFVRDEVRRQVAEATRVDDYLSTARAAELADVAPNTIRRWVHDGKLTRHKAGRVIRISRNELERLLRDGASNDELTPEEHAAKALG